MDPEDFAVRVVLEHEGGFDADPGRGGKTRFGISEKSYPEVWKQGGPSLDEARRIYKRDFWETIRGDQLAQIDPGLAVSMMDFAVNAGPKQATELLQRGVGAKTDGVLGSKTLARVREVGGEAAEGRLNQLRMAFYHALAEQDPKRYRPALQGWLGRVESTADAAEAARAATRFRREPKAPARGF